MKATINRWVEAVGSRLKVTQRENTGKQEEKGELFTTTAQAFRAARKAQRNRTADSLGLLWKLGKKEQAAYRRSTAYLYAHTAARSNHHLARLCLHIHTRSAQDRIPRVDPRQTENPLGAERTDPPVSESVRRRRTRRRKGRETGKPRLNCSPAGRVACCRGRGRPGSKHGVERRRRQPIQRENGRSQEGCGERRRGERRRSGRKGGCISTLTSRTTFHSLFC